MGKQIFYRGYLNSCNYACSYCPFSKRKMTKRQIEKDQKALWKFVDNMKQEKEKHAVQIVPYGEALVHEYYWRALAELSQITTQEYTGCQTNLSFSVEKMLGIYEQYQGRKEKLRLWCTFHPSMTTVEEFVEQCKKLEIAGVSFCVGMVGDPEEIPTLLELRRRLPDSVYVWVNKMDGRKKKYTMEEVEVFQKVDPYFSLQLEHRKADLQKCRQSVFYEADGSRYFCNLHAAAKGASGSAGCGRSECNCYLAYCNRKDIEELLFFEPYPAFRIPTYPKAIFLDVDGTIVPEGEKELSDYMAERLWGLSKKCRLFLATELPFREAMRKCKKIEDCLSGGVFAGGGHIRIKREHQKAWEQIIPTKEIFSKEQQEDLERKYQLQFRKYQKDNILYRETLVAKRRAGWTVDEQNALQKEIEKIVESKEISCTLHLEKGHFGITGEKADKKNGVLTICEKEGISLSDGAAVGNAKEDIPMLQLFPVKLYRNRENFEKEE